MIFFLTTFDIKHQIEWNLYISYVINKYIKGNNRGKCLQLIPMDKNKYLLKSTTSYGIKHLIESI